jgi:hypothetical protein
VRSTRCSGKAAGRTCTLESAGTTNRELAPSSPAASRRRVGGEEPARPRQVSRRARGRLAAVGRPGPRRSIAAGHRGEALPALWPTKSRRYWTASSGCHLIVRLPGRLPASRSEPLRWTHDDGRSADRAAAAASRRGTTRHVAGRRNATTPLLRRSTRRRIRTAARWAGVVEGAARCEGVTPTGTPSLVGGLHELGGGCKAQALTTTRPATGLRGKGPARSNSGGRS